MKQIRNQMKGGRLQMKEARIQMMHIYTSDQPRPCHKFHDRTFMIASIGEALLLDPSFEIWREWTHSLTNPGCWGKAATKSFVGNSVKVGYENARDPVGNTAIAK
jgi:hypothetical protein